MQAPDSAREARSLAGTAARPQVPCGSHVTLGVSVNGRTVAAQQARVATYMGYQKYSLVFKASARSSIKVWFYAPKVHPVKN